MLKDKQKAALESIKDAPGHIAIIHFGVLNGLGYAESATVPGGSRGYAGAKITPAGLAAL